MSQENVEIVRQAFDAFNRGDLEAVVSVCDPAVEWFPPKELPSPSAYRGHQGVRDATPETCSDTFSGVKAEPERLIDAGDQVIVLFLWEWPWQGKWASTRPIRQTSGCLHDAKPEGGQGSTGSWTWLLHLKPLVSRSKTLTPAPELSKVSLFLAHVPCGCQPIERTSSGLPPPAGYFGGDVAKERRDRATLE